MGILITKFRKKKTTLEVLEKLENEIKSIEEFSRSTEQTQKKMVGRFIFVSICVYCITALIFYFYFFPATAYERIIYIIPLIILPILLIFIKRILSWYYNRKIRKNEKKLTTLKNEKKKILEDVMDKETYKVAKTILEKFAPEQVKKNVISSEATPNRSVALAPIGSVTQGQTGLRYRGQFPSSATLPSFPRTSPQSKFKPPAIAATPLTASIKSSPQSLVPSIDPRSFSGTPLALPRAVLPRERTVLDKMVDYLIGDGPSNRYALICKNCSSHNGMALKEEFDYLSFKCCYCFTFNPARKQRPLAPKLEPLTFRNKKSDISDSDKHSESDSDSSESTIPKITEPPNDSHDETEEKAPSLSDYEIKNSDDEPSSMENKSDTNLESHGIQNDNELEVEKNVEPVISDETKD